jgi:uncharacterized protein
VGEFYTIINYSWHYWHALITGRLDEYGPTPLQEAAFCGYVGTVRSCLENGVDANETDLIGITPLCAAVYGGQEETARILLEHGAKTAGVGLSKALRYAAAHGHSEVVQLLRETRK